MCLLDNILPVHWAKAMSIEQILGYKGPVCFCVARMKGPGQRGGWQEGSWWALPVGRGKLDYVKLMRGDRAKQHQASCRLYDPPQIMASADPESGKRPSDPKQLRPSYCSLQSWCNQMVLKSQKKKDITINGQRICPPRSLLGSIDEPPYWAEYPKLHFQKFCSCAQTHDLENCFA